VGFLLELIIQFVLEFILQVVAEILVEFGMYEVRNLFGGKRGWSTFLALVGHISLGAAVGALSILVFPHSFIHSNRFHGISLLVTPVLAGLAMSAVGWARKKREQNLIRLDTFVYGAVFAFGFALVRFFFTIPKPPVQ
jgi:uncharacterized membrane protein